jgi:hypothetical protein
LFSKQNFHPSAAAIAQKICHRDDDGEMHVLSSHAYYAQLQCEMFVTGFHTSYLVIFTRKGVTPVKVAFDKEWWDIQMAKLRSFYLEVYFPLWSSQFDHLNAPTSSLECDFHNDVTDCDTEVAADVPKIAETCVVDCEIDDLDQVDVSSHCDMEVAADLHEIVETCVVDCDDLGVSNDGAVFLHFLDSIEAERLHQHRIEQEMDGFSSLLAGQNLCIHGHTPSDGNCFFEAVSDQLQKTSATSASSTLSHSDLRAMVCDHLSGLSLQEKAELEQSIPGQTLAQYIASMRRCGTYADDIILEYTSQMLCTPITVIDPAQNVHVGQDYIKERLYLGFIPNLQHYASLAFKSFKIVGRVHVVLFP